MPASLFSSRVLLASQPLTIRIGARWRLVQWIAVSATPPAGSLPIPLVTVDSSQSRHESVQAPCLCVSDDACWFRRDRTDADITHVLPDAVEQGCTKFC